MKAADDGPAIRTKSLREIVGFKYKTARTLGGAEQRDLGFGKNGQVTYRINMLWRVMA